MELATYTNYEQLPLFLGAKDIAAALGISRSTAYKLTQQNEFPTMKVGDRIVVPKDKFISWIDQKIV